MQLFEAETRSDFAPSLFVMVFKTNRQLLKESARKVYATTAQKCRTVKESNMVFTDWKLKASICNFWIFGKTIYYWINACCLASWHSSDKLKTIFSVFFRHFFLKSHKRVIKIHKLICQNYLIKLWKDLNDKSRSSGSLKIGYDMQEQLITAISLENYNGQLRLDYTSVINHFRRRNMA